MRISEITKFNRKNFNGQVSTAAPNPASSQNNAQQSPVAEKTNLLKRIPTSTYIYSAAAIGILVGGIALHHHFKNSSTHLPKPELKTEPKSKLFLNEVPQTEQTEEILDVKPAEEIATKAEPEKMDSMDKTFKNLETELENSKDAFKLDDSSERKKFFEDFDFALESNEDNAENKAYAFLTNPDNSRKAQNLIYSHMENDYEPAFDNLVDRLYVSDAGRTYLPSLRVITKRGNENDVKEIQKILQTPHVSSMIYTNIAVSYKKLPKERFDKDIIPIFEGLYADKKPAFLQVFEAHKSNDYLPILGSMSGIKGYESYIYPQIEHAKNACMG